MNRRAQRTQRRLLSFFGLLCVLVFSLCTPLEVSAQEFEPRTYSVAPVGLNFFAIGYGYATGAVFMDPSLPVDDVDGKVHIAFARYVRTFSLLGKPSKAKVFMPWSSGHWDGLVEGDFRTRDATGIGDMRFVLETQFSGAEVKTPSEMAGYSPKTVWGGRLQIAAPTGDYDDDRAINLGANRWTFIPEVGFGKTLGKWSIEGALAAWIFTNNNDYYGGRTLDQGPLLVAKFYAVRSIRPGFWWAVSAGYGYGGQTAVNGERRATIQRNWRFSVMLAYPITPKQGFSISLLSGGNLGAGTDSDAIAVAYQVAW